MTARTATASSLAAAVLALAAPALASAPPVGPLPAGPTTTISTARGELRAVGPGTARLSYGATRGETAKAYAAKRFVVNVR
jgi:hypothetical protein